MEGKGDELVDDIEIVQDSPAYKDTVNSSGGRLLDIRELCEQG